MPLLLVCIFFAVLSLFPASAEANWEADYEKNYGKLDMNDFIGKSIQDYIAFQQKGGKTNTEVMGRGYLIDNILLNQWVITRSVVHGFSNFQSAIDRMMSDDVSKAIMLPTAQTLADSGADWTLFSTFKPAESAPKLTISDVNLNAPIIRDSNILQAHKKYVSILEDVNKGGFFGGPTIFRKMQLVGMMLLFMTTMIKLAMMAYRHFVEDDTIHGVAWFRVFFKMIALMFLIMYAGRIAMFGISMSDSIKGLVLNGAFSGGNGIDTVMSLMDARMDYVSIKMSFSFLDFISGSISSFLAYGLGWIGYFLASGALFILIVAGDVMMGLTVIMAPIICALTFLPGFENSIGNWMKSYITLLFYGPLAAVYAVLLVAIMTIGIDTSPVVFIIISVSFIMGATQIPHMAKNLSGTVMAGLAITIASMPIKFAAAGVSGGLQGAGRTVLGMGR